MHHKSATNLAPGQISLLAAAVCAALRASAAGDTSAAAPETTLEAVVVTAERRSESIQEVPLSVTAISGETLEKFGDVNFGDYAHTIPNLSFGTGSDFGVTNGRTVTIRGITGGRFRNGLATRRCRCRSIRESSIWSASRCCAARRARCSGRPPWGARCA